ncbi:MAG: sodium:solute symporter [Bacteroidaceae bacterium]|nr:sodium:solute symporter [Bacteroidaceae bacterium]
MMWVLVIYLALLWWVSRRQGRGNDAFFRGERRSSWLMVAYGMVGASVSGVSFVSVPGMVATQDMTYLQTCMGFVLGYALVAFVLLPIYYRLNLTSIYTLLERRLGESAYRVGAWLFIVSDMVGTAVKFLLVSVILQQFVFDGLGLPFAVTVPLLVGAIWLYTKRGGVHTLVLTDVLQTTCMLAALCMIIRAAMEQTGVNFGDLMSWFGRTSGDVMERTAVSAGVMEHTRVFEFSDWTSKQHFVRQFVSGAFIVVVMTGLNQNMMQKNLTCKSLRDAQKDMCLSGTLFLPVNALFLVLGALLLQLPLTASGDGLLPEFVSGTAQTGGVVAVLFVLGIVAAAFSSADSSLTALTTSFCVDVMRREDDTRLRRRVHVGMSLVLVVLVHALSLTGSQSMIDLVYTLVGYTYGPLLGLFALALLPASSGGERTLRLGAWTVAAVCIASPAVCYVLAQYVTLGYELLLVNGALTFLMLKILSRCRK